MRALPFLKKILQKEDELSKDPALAQEHANFVREAGGKLTTWLSTFVTDSRSHPIMEYDNPHDTSEKLMYSLFDRKLLDRSLVERVVHTNPDIALVKQLAAMLNIPIPDKNERKKTTSTDIDSSATQPSIAT